MGHQKTLTHEDPLHSHSHSIHSSPFPLLSVPFRNGMTEEWRERKDEGTEREGEDNKRMTVDTSGTFISDIFILDYFARKGHNITQTNEVSGMMNKVRICIFAVYCCLHSLQLPFRFLRLTYSPLLPHPLRTGEPKWTGMKLKNEEKWRETNEPGRDTKLKTKRKI